jgi:hypothetical protein
VGNRRAFVVALTLATVACGLDLVGTESSSSDAGPDATPNGPDRALPDGDVADGGTDGAQSTDGGCVCAATAVCEDAACVDITSPLVAMRIELPCTNDASPACSCPVSVPDVTKAIGGDPAKTYGIQLRVRGVVEQRTYTGSTPGTATGTNATFFAQGGDESNRNDTWNIDDLRISKPAFTWHLNTGVTGHTWADGVDYVATIAASGGATVTLHSDSIDPAMARNRDQAGDAIVVPGIPPAPQPYFGQFLQIDPVSVTLLPP